MHAIDAILSVRLCDFEGIPDIKQSEAESRFAAVLLRELGGMESAANACKAFALAGECAEEDMTDEEISLAKRWVKAYEKARIAGFRDLGESPEAFFDVRIV